jgi:ATP-binding cassette subfamily C protein
LAWLGVLLAASGLGALSSRQVFRQLGGLVEPVRDDLVERVVTGALRHAVVGRPDDGTVARLTRQVESVRDAYAGMILAVRGFAVAVAGAIAGLLTIAPVVVLLILPPFLLGVGTFVATLGVSAARQRASVLADERLAAAAGAVLTGVRDVVACGAEEHAARLVGGPIEAQASAERALAGAAALRTACFAIGGWVPLVVLLAAAPWLVGRGLGPGAILGGLTYVLFGLQPALSRLMTGLGGSGLRFVVTLGRILDATARSVQPVRAARPAAGYDLAVRDLTFAYGPHAEPVVRDLDLAVPEGDHLAVIGPSGAGKSTLARLLCGLLPPDAGLVRLGGVPVAAVPLDRLAQVRVLIPQEAYVFSATVRDNVAYLHPQATDAEAAAAAEAVGAGALLDRLGGPGGQLRPSELSAGERQLIALARAYLSRAPLVVLDEATCYLDPTAERVAEEAFAARPGTLIVIAHRVSSALRARRILVLDGAVAVVGDQASLLASSPLYGELLGHWQAAQIQPAS